MAIIRTLVAQDENDDNQWLRVDHRTRFIQNSSTEWQFLFGPDSVLNNSSQITKIAARFDDNTFNNIQITAYLYDKETASIASGANCTFSVYKVVTPDWTEQFIGSYVGTVLPSTYFYTTQTLSTLGLDFLGGDTLMIEATIMRLGLPYRDRIYVNHLGIYDNVTRLRQDVEFLDITKKDL